MFGFLSSFKNYDKQLGKFVFRYKERQIFHFYETPYKRRYNKYLISSYLNNDKRNLKRLIEQGNLSKMNIEYIIGNMKIIYVMKKIIRREYNVEGLIVPILRFNNIILMKWYENRTDHDAHYQLDKRITDYCDNNLSLLKDIIKPYKFRYFKPRIMTNYNTIKTLYNNNHRASKTIMNKYFEKYLENLNTIPSDLSSIFEK